MLNENTCITESVFGVPSGLIDSDDDTVSIIVIGQA